MDELAIEKFKRLGERLSSPPTPKISAEQEYWQGQAIKLAEICKADMVVVNRGHNDFQPWHKSIADKCGVEYCYVAEYKDGGDNV